MLSLNRNMFESGRLEDPSVMDVDAVARALSADLENGLTSQEAARRLAVAGPNELRVAPPVPTWRRSPVQLQDPLVYLLLVAISLVAELLEATKEEPTPLQKEVGRIGRVLGIAVIAIAVVVVATVLLISDIRTAADVITVLLLGVSLAVAYRPLDPGEETAADESLERDLIFVGTVGIIDPPREEAAVAILGARRAGIRVVMITGDHPRTATRIAADLGIVDDGRGVPAAGAPALSGCDLDALDDAACAQAVRTTSVYARVAPEHKMRIVDALQADGHIVAMTGDGVNDATALKAADIGIAMGVTGTEVTKQAAKMILADDNCATIVEAVREGRAIFANIRKFLRYLSSSNMGEVLTVFLGVVLSGMIGLPVPARG